MIFSTQNQLNCLLIFVLGGIILGFISNVFSVLFAINFQKKYIKSLFLSIFYAFLSIFFVFLINFFNFGKFSLTLLIFFLLAYLWAKTLFKKTLVILERKWYNVCKQKHEFLKKRFIKQHKKGLNELSKKS